MTFNTKLLNFRGHYVSLESIVWGHLKQMRAKSPFLRDRANLIGHKGTELCYLSI